MRRAHKQAVAAGALGGLLAAWLGVLGVQPAGAQPGRAGLPPARSPRDAAPIELAGQWVSIVTEDWRFRMVTPPKGDYSGVSLTSAGLALANAWDPARDEAQGNACKAYGAPAIMRVPGRVRISWADAATLEIETDAGMQRRALHFGEPPEPSGGPSWQGVSRAQWIPHGGRRGRPPVNGSLKVVTTGLKAGYLRKNGVPYGERAVLTEYFDLLSQPDGSEWLVVKTIVEDPEHLTAPFVTSSNFRREGEGGGWSPSPCSAY